MQWAPGPPARSCELGLHRRERLTAGSGPLSSGQALKLESMGARGIEPRTSRV